MHMKSSLAQLALVVMLVIMLSGQAARAADSCLALPDDRLITQCLDSSAENAEKNLRAALSRAYASGDKEHRTLLDASQTAWKTFRDTECVLEVDSFRGGTLQFERDVLCLIGKDEERARELDQDVDLASH
jgi:uncharacterized protein YecT (DUF1311 family)